MTPSSVIRTSVDLWIKALRLPVDTANRVLGRRGLEVDAAEGAVRETAGQVLGDEELRTTGTRRRVATEKRADAQRLRDASKTVADQADEEADARKAQAAAQRKQADQDAQERKRRAAQQAEERRQTAAEDERRRKHVTEQASAERREAAEAEAKRRRLEALDDAAEALEERDDALVAEEEASRLKAVAGNAKATRKS
ncbi:MAG: hypothetical protein JWN65_2088 [Solirubrobacterales bacterium]|nr:hypothetical protein [Solirubrobacterales bacterium]